MCTSANHAPYGRVQAAPEGGLIRDVKCICDDFSCVVLHWPNDHPVQRAVYELDAAALHTKHSREPSGLGGASAHVGPQESSDSHDPASSGGRVRHDAEEGCGR